MTAIYDLFDESCCYIDPRCEGAGSSHDEDSLSVVAADLGGAVVCLTLCRDCWVSGLLPEIPSGAIRARAAAHIRHAHDAAREAAART